MRGDLFRRQVREGDVLLQAALREHRAVDDVWKEQVRAKSSVDLEMDVFVIADDKRRNAHRPGSKRRRPRCRDQNVRSAASMPQSAERPGAASEADRFRSLALSEAGVDSNKVHFSSAQEIKGHPQIAGSHNDVRAGLLEGSREGCEVLHLRRVVDIYPDAQPNGLRPSSSSSLARAQNIQAADQRTYGIRLLYLRWIW